jgi:hypothetical protein
LQDEVHDAAQDLIVHWKRFLLEKSKELCENDFESETHLSMSRPLALRELQIKPFVETLKLKLKHFPSP